ncbi:tetratricopeptide repeat protein [Psychroflexus aestuariivivens]|uniref:tetratricopeptide repeat protein n=1 Tax=Psychroflexus aestuariivivens TaxID=1795040 RepID=UPI000FDAACF3|nr:tetratricopeptide repeat protein [Psychroflexus aestuariivivens]
MKHFFLLILSLPTILFAQPTLEKAKTAYENEYYKEAVDYFKNYLTQNPKSVEAREYLSASYAELEKWQESADIAKTLVEEFPENADYHFKYGGALGLVAKNSNPFKAMSLLDEVKTHLHKAAELDENHIQSRRAMLEMYLELPGIAGGSESKAKQFAREIQNIDAADGKLAWAHIYQKSEDFNKAEAYYETALDIQKSEKVYLNFSEFYAETEQIEKQFEILETGFKNLNSAKILLKYIDLAKKNRKNIEKANRLLDSFQPENPNSKSAEQLKKMNFDL